MTTEGKKECNEWQIVNRHKLAWETTRLKVDGGHLYHHKNFYHVGNGYQQTTSMCFVPDVDLQRYQAHLRDAYNQGFKDGKEESSVNLPKVNFKPGDVIAIPEEK